MQRPPARLLFIHTDEGSEPAVESLRPLYDVHEAHGAEAALEMAAQLVPEVVVLDLAPASTELLRALRSSPACRDSILVQFTADATDRRAGATDSEHAADVYLSPPVHPEELQAQLEAVLRIRGAERRSRSQVFEWKATFDAITDAILVLDKRATIVQCNRAAARFLRRPRDSVLGMSYAQALQGGEGQGLQTLADFTAPDAISRPYTTETPVGDRWYRLAVDPIREGEQPGGDASGDVVIVLTDITELKLLEEELRRRSDELALRNQRQGEFLALLAHELRNPLAAIRAAQETLESDVEQQPSTQSSLRIIDRQTVNLTRMVSDLLDVSRIAQGRVTLRCAHQDLRDCARRAIDAMEASVKSKNHTLHVELPAEPIIVDVDAARIEQVLANLIDNAVKYTPSGGDISIRLYPEQIDDTWWAILEVQDTGAGMPPDRIHEAFDMFVQYERTLDRAQGGLGLGLNLVKRIVELHRGRVTAHSEGPDRGTRLSVRLPRIDPNDARTGIHRHAAPPAPEPQRALRVLLVEDNDDLRNLTAHTLRRAGHRVSEAGDGLAGRHAAQQEHFDAIVMDLGLPKLEGYALASELRSSGPNTGSHLIALTGYGSSEDRQRALAAGFDHHLVKPVRFAKLKALLRQGRPTHP